MRLPSSIITRGYFLIYHCYQLRKQPVKENWRQLRPLMEHAVLLVALLCHHSISWHKYQIALKQRRTS